MIVPYTGQAITPGMTPTDNAAATFTLPDDVPTQILPDGSVGVGDFNQGDRDKVALAREYMRRLRDPTPHPAEESES